MSVAVHTTVMSGAVAINEQSLAQHEQREIARALTVTTPPYKHFPGQVVRAYDQQNGFLLVPRYYDYPRLWSQVDSWQWAAPQIGYPLQSNMVLDPARGQPAAVDGMVQHLQEHAGGILVAGTGVGKCLGRGTSVLMADGRVKPVEAVVVGDRLASPSGGARLVLSTNVGKGPLYRVMPTKGEPWVCNDVHVLTLVHTVNDSIVDIPLDEWATKCRKFKHCHKQFSVGVESFENEAPSPSVDPYFLGVWFGDGTKTTRAIVGQPDGLSGVQVSKPDHEIRAICREVAAAWNLKMRVSDEDRCPTYSLVGERGVRNLLLCVMRDLVGPDVRVPDCILRGSRRTRLAFLAGFLDADGTLGGNCFIITQKREDWARAAWWLARSLGLCATIITRRARDQNGTEGTYYVVSISGDTDQIPTRIARKQARARKQKKVATRTGFTVSSIGEGDYYGFTLDGDGRFLLGDFTVTHNTLMALEIARRFETPIAVFIYVHHMLDNWVTHIKQHLGIPESDIGFVQGERCDLGKPITLISVQSVISKRYPDALYEQFGILVIDECHRYGAAIWHQALGQFPARYRLAVSADPSRPDGLDQIVRWSFGSVGHRIRRKQSVDKALVCVCEFPSVYNEWAYHDIFYEHGERQLGDPNALRYDKLLAKDTKRNTWLIKQVVDARAKNRSILVFAKLRAHVESLHESFETAWAAYSASNPDAPLTTSALMLGGAVSKKAKAAAQLALKADVLFTTYGYAKDAMNATQLDTLFFASPAGNPLQPIGRLRDVAVPGKQELLVIDPWEPNDYASGRMERRVSIYRKLGHPVKRIKAAP